jgi:hypothetical protein
VGFLNFFWARYMGCEKEKNRKTEILSFLFFFYYFFFFFIIIYFLFLRIRLSVSCLLHLMALDDVQFFFFFKNFIRSC